MRDAFVIVGVILLFGLIAAPWNSIYDLVWKERNKKYKSREDVI